MLCCGAAIRSFRQNQWSVGPGMEVNQIEGRASEIDQHLRKSSAIRWSLCPGGCKQELGRESDSEEATVDNVVREGL